ncbi:hypothetical protein LINPERPRIM_LOCUS31632 [Linum perenne]
MIHDHIIIQPIKSKGPLISYVVMLPPSLRYARHACFR